ncbi:MAG: hypothetical protein KDA24_25640 [Deltaproteobacteria bacterium]|nr:hypothetical protein [Deltaproteobacteria bacterium]
MTTDHADVEPASTTPEPGRLPTDPPDTGPPAPGEPAGPGAIDATLRRGVALISGLALVVAFFLPWLEQTDINLRTLTGLQIVLDGEMSSQTRAAVAAVPGLGIILLIAGYVGRRSALFVGLLAGISLIVVGAWQTLSYLAESIGTGLWVVAAASLLAVIGGIPWQRIVRNALNK